MPLSDLIKKTEGLNFDIAAEEMRRLSKTPNEIEKIELYSLYKQSLHGDIPSNDIYPIPSDTFQLKKYQGWASKKGIPREIAMNEYVKMAEEMINKYGRTVIRTKWNSQVWTVDY